MNKLIVTANLKIGGFIDENVTLEKSFSKQEELINALRQFTNHVGSSIELTGLTAQLAFNSQPSTSENLTQKIKLEKDDEVILSYVALRMLFDEITKVVSEGKWVPSLPNDRQITKIQLIGSAVRENTLTLKHVTHSLVFLGPNPQPSNAQQIRWSVEVCADVKGTQNETDVFETIVVTLSGTARLKSETKIVIPDSVEIDEIWLHPDTNPA